jgi:hypothetical protein
MIKAYYHANIRIVTEFLGVLPHLAGPIEVRLNGGRGELK